MAVSRRLIEFERLDTAEVEDALASLPDGAWINIEPIIPPEPEEGEFLDFPVIDAGETSLLEEGAEESGAEAEEEAQAGDDEQPEIEEKAEEGSKAEEDEDGGEDEEEDGAAEDAGNGGDAGDGDGDTEDESSGGGS